VPAPGKTARPVGSRLPLDYARETQASFVTPGARAAVAARTSFVEPHQSFDHQRLWAELLWSPALAFNLFGDCWADARVADAAVRAWWPDTPGRVSEVKFAHSPGRFDPAYLGSLRDFDAAFLLDLGDGTQGIVAVDVNYHERSHKHVAKPSGRPRQHEVAARAGIFERDAIDAVDKTDMLVTSLEHLLLLSMLQHESGRWQWGRYVVVYPEGNVDVADMCARYADHLVERETFSTATLESLLDAVSPRSALLLRDRYVVV